MGSLNVTRHGCTWEVHRFVAGLLGLMRWVQVMLPLLRVLLEGDALTLRSPVGGVTGWRRQGSLLSELWLHGEVCGYFRKDTAVPGGALQDARLLATTCFCYHLSGS